MLMNTQIFSESVIEVGGKIGHYVHLRALKTNT